MEKPCRNVTGTVTMKEKPSLHPKRESRALQTRFGGTEERSIKYESDPQTVNFISVLPLIQKEPRNGRDIIGKISMPETVPTSLGVSEKVDRNNSVWKFVICVYDHPGDEAILVKKMVSDRTLPEYHIDLISESSGVALLEPSRSIRRFLRFLQNPWQRDYVSGRGFRDVWTSDAALVGGGSETSGLATQIVWGVDAETFAFDAALEGGGTETDCTSDAARLVCSYKTGEQE
ncbi:hypothetical protein F2Q69_00035538 [Brassica cretica]|uniref:Uncharacterized protein n=1 Tax=Brassica cretica TaxID=69181 RepID=A0A8S9SNS2_BRACR|nr:hypothetical protein F2Q69_00035538 [Brassica cretica]